MLIKMKESKGFTLVELMIVVAIIGILAAVAVPFYQRYVQKARLTSLVFPGVHAIETNIGAYFAVRNELPTGPIATYAADASTACFTPAWSGTALTININTTSTSCGLVALNNLAQPHMVATPDTTSGNKITKWALTGSLVDELGLK
jgi:type IV pilus assembly protein PilA